MKYKYVYGTLVEEFYQGETNYWDKNLSQYYSVHIPNYE
jgi:hypothetical protein